MNSEQLNSLQTEEYLTAKNRMNGEQYKNKMNIEQLETEGILTARNRRNIDS